MYSIGFGSVACRALALPNAPRWLTAVAVFGACDVLSHTQSSTRYTICNGSANQTYYP